LCREKSQEIDTRTRSGIVESKLKVVKIPKYSKQEITPSILSNVVFDILYRTRMEKLKKKEEKEKSQYEGEQKRFIIKRTANVSG
jgi:stalled ribosome alternative rescue factor ArfA